MFVRNRMPEVVKLRCNACQDFLRMVIIPEWRGHVYEAAQTNITGKYRDKYVAVYDKMREKGLEKYDIDDMDVTFISQIINFHDKIAPAKKETREAIRQLAIDRNVTSHSSENEADEELYQRGLLALCNLTRFVGIVDREETTIDDKQRLAYHRKYDEKITELKRILDEERISIVQREKSMEMDIKKILESDDPLKKWVEFFGLYMDRCKIDRDLSLLNAFALKASDMKVTYAHACAIDYQLSEKKFEEVERRLLMLYHAYEFTPTYECKIIVDSIDKCLRSGYPLTENFNQMITGLMNQGYNITNNEDGSFEWKKNPVSK